MLMFLEGILVESLKLFNEMSPYLLMGFVFAGILHVFISIETIGRHLGADSFGSVLKSVIFGIPLPLCSCAVLPAAVLLRRNGASKGSVVSFLIATPITGVDSIFATYSLLGPVFAACRVIASSIVAIVAGFAANLFLSKGPAETPLSELEGSSCSHCCKEGQADAAGSRGRIIEFFHYSFIRSIGDIWKWLLLGTVIGGAISFLLPEAFSQRYLGNSWLSMVLMLAVGIPMYVCSTGSIPIAASLLLKGMTPGAALVFLLVGPATNAVTITVISNELGKKATLIYVTVIAVMGLAMGLSMDMMSGWLGLEFGSEHVHEGMLPVWVHAGSSAMLGTLMAVACVKGLVPPKSKEAMP